MKKKNLIVLILGSVLIVAGVGIGIFYQDAIENWKIQKELSGQPELLQQFEKIKELQKKSEDAQHNNAGYLVTLGFEWKSLGDITQNKVYYEKALEVYKKGIEKFGEKNVPFYWNGGKVAETLGDYSQAEALYKESIRVAPSYSEPHRYLAELYEYKMKKTDNEVLTVFSDGLKATNGEANIYLDQCSYLRRHGRTQDALECYKLLVQSYPDNSMFKDTVQELQKELNQ